MVVPLWPAPQLEVMVGYPRKGPTFKISPLFSIRLLISNLKNDISTHKNHEELLKQN